MQEAATIARRGIATAIALLALACGGGQDPHQLAVEPEAPAVAVGETLVLQARPQGDQGQEADWEVQEQYGGGLLQSQGLRVTYVPPEAAGTYHLILRSPGRDGRMRKQVVEVRVVPSPTIEPASARLQPGSAVTFRVRMRGLARDAATWAVEGEGEIGPDGRYVAPRRPGIYHVTATSVVDPSAVARATVTVAAD